MSLVIYHNFPTEKSKFVRSFYVLMPSEKEYEILGAASQKKIENTYSYLDTKYLCKVVLQSYIKLIIKYYKIKAPKTK